MGIKNFFEMIALYRVLQSKENIFRRDLNREGKEWLYCNLNDLYVIPRIIVYNREKNNFFNCRNSCLNCCKKKVDKFYRAGGEISSFQEVNNIIDGLQNPALENISSNDNQKLTSTLGNNSYLFEQIKGKRDLILPTFYKVLLNMAETKNNYEFIQKMYKSYQNSSDYKKLLTPILNIPDIPLELLSKFYARLYTIEGNFYKDMKNNLRNTQQNNTIYMPFIKTLYEGVERGALKMCTGKELYNASFLNEQELKDLKNYKDQRELDLPMAIIFSKAFLSFTKDKGIAEGFYSNGGKNTMLTIEAEKREYDLLTHADIEDLSYYTHEKEVLFFPFSAFGIQDFYYDGSKRRYEIKLIYLGKYIQKFEKDADFITSNAQLPNTHFKELLENSGLVEKEKVERMKIKDVSKKFKTYKIEKENKKNKNPQNKCNVKRLLIVLIIIFIIAVAVAIISPIVIKNKKNDDNNNNKTNNKTYNDKTIICSQGSYYNSKSSTCEICNPGYYSQKGATECTKCPPGKYSEKGASSCINCPSGTFSNDTTFSCVACPEGFYSEEGSSECKTY